MYDADDIAADKKVRQRLKAFEDAGYGHFPVGIAKTQCSFSTDPTLRDAPSGHTVQIHEVRLSAGAEFVVVVCGEIMTMPRLPRTPVAEGMGIGGDGELHGPLGHQPGDCECPAKGAGGMPAPSEARQSVRTMPVV